MIDASTYATLRQQIDAFENARKAFDPKRYQRGGGYAKEEWEAIARQAGLERPPTNEERGQVEQYEFVTNPPDRYFAYVNERTRRLTTWMGDDLGEVGFGREYRDSFGGRRVSITIYAINGKRYYGTYFKSSGDYARIKVSKR
jgi:hypothetical protein